jgi:hypothetical protein
VSPRTIAPRKLNQNCSSNNLNKGDFKNNGRSNSKCSHGSKAASPTPSAPSRRRPRLGSQQLPRGTLAELAALVAILQRARAVTLIAQVFPLLLLFRFRPGGVSRGGVLFCERLGRECAGSLIENDSISASAGDFFETLLIVSL